MYKSEFGLEKYFTILPPDLMYNMCKFRCGSHKLQIEMGRFFSIDRSERICDLSNNLRKTWVMNFTICLAVLFSKMKGKKIFLSNYIMLQVQLVLLS